MVKTKSLKTQPKERRPAVAKRAFAGRVAKSSELGQSFQRASSPVFVMPKLSGAAAAELMKAAGILTPSGKLTKSYR